MFFDFDEDGKMDMFLGNGGINPDVLPPELGSLLGEIPEQREPNRLFRNTGDGANAWVRVDVRGDGLNLDAIGALVRVSESDDPGGVRRLRHVHRSAGFNSSQAREVTVGMGTVPGPVDVEVTFPDGEAVVVDRIGAGETVVVTHP